MTITKNPWYRIGCGLMVAACFLSKAALSQVTGAEEPSKVPSQMYTPQQLVEDFRIVRRALEEGHPGLYRYVPKEQLDRDFDATEKRLDHSMDVYGFYRTLAPMIAAIECGHTRVNLPDSARASFSKSAPLLPLQVKIIGQKIYVFRDLAIEDDGLVGSEISSINGMPGDKIVAALTSATQGDGEIPTGRLQHVGQNFPVLLSLLLEMHPPYSIAYREAGTGPEKRVELPGLTRDRMVEIMRAKFPRDGLRPDRSANLLFQDTGKIAVMTIHQFDEFTDTDQKQSMAAFLQESFTQLQQKGTKSLILDLRNNGGGADDMGKLLFAYLTDKPFLYYDDLVLNASQPGPAGHALAPSFLPEKDIQKMPGGNYRLINHPNWGQQQPSQTSFAGKVLVLMNGGSFSTTCEFLSTAHFHHRAVFIGEEAGGGYYGNTSGFTRDLTLPNTKLTVFIPMMKYVMAVSGYRYPKRGVMPDYPIQPTISDLLANRDPAMVFALSLARKDEPGGPN